MSTTVTVYMPDREARRRVRQAARIAGKPPAAFMREAVLEASARVLAEAAKHREECPTCGRPHKKAEKNAA